MCVSLIRSAKSVPNFPNIVKKAISHIGFYVGKIVGKTWGKKEVELPEDIHTFAGWKALGYSVKKGEKAVSKFPIWKYVKAKASEAEDANADGEASGHCIMKVAAFFSASQVQRS